LSVLSDEDKYLLTVNGILSVLSDGDNYLEHAPKAPKLEVLPKIHLMRFGKSQILIRELVNNYWGNSELLRKYTEFKEGKEA
jgi:hypothetical protein